MAKSEASEPFQIALAPERLWQAINPWSFAWSGDQMGLINISLGQTRSPAIEQAVLEEVGSYGRQLGHLGEALEVLIDHFDQSALSPKQRDALAIVKGELAEIRQIKSRVDARE